jgi:hypothetical protein
MMAEGQNSIARQRLGKHSPAAMDMHATIEEPWEVFSVWFMPRLYNEDQWDKLVSHMYLVVSQQAQLVVGHEHVSRGIPMVRSFY